MGRGVLGPFLTLDGPVWSALIEGVILIKKSALRLSFVKLIRGSLGSSLGPRALLI